MNKKSKKGFTLLELIIVLGISALVTVAIGGGVVTLQANIKVDNAIRNLKLQIQTVQSSARTSFITSGNQSRAQNLFDYGGNANLSLGWIIEFKNENANTAVVTRRSVFFKPSPSYRINQLKSDIDAFYNRLNNGITSINKVEFACDGQNFLLNGQPLIGANAFTSVTGENLEIFCGSTALTGSEYFSFAIQNMQFSSDFPSGANNLLNSCFEPNGQKSIFFATGYARPVLNYSYTNPTADCQLMIKTTGLAKSSQAVRISKINGVVEICGAYCVR